MPCRNREASGQAPEFLVRGSGDSPSARGGWKSQGLAADGLRRLGSTVANPLTHTWAFGSHHHPGCVPKAGKSALRRVASYTSTGRQSPPKLWCSRGASGKPNHRHPEVVAQHACLKVSAASRPSAADSLQARHQSWARRFGTAAQGNERRWHWPHPPVARTPAASCRVPTRPSPA